MDAATFGRFRELVYQRSGINLRDGKEALVSARVAKRMRTLGLADPSDYLARVIEDDTGQELVLLLDAISTNVTSFFREPAHFELLGRLVREWVQAGKTRFRFWSAASSTGEEPYSMAMTILDAFGARNLDVRILATDISTRVLEQARQGVYPADRVAQVPPALRQRFLRAASERGAGQAVVNEELQRMVLFRRLNLAEPPFPMKGPLDVVFCRNVMIYFDDRVRAKLLGEIHRLLKPGGYLMVGHAESLTGMVSPFKSVRPAVYQKV